MLTASINLNYIQISVGLHQAVF